MERADVPGVVRGSREAVSFIRVYPSLSGCSPTTPSGHRMVVRSRYPTRAYKSGGNVPLQLQ